MTDSPQRRAALFVDFDNIYLGLRQLDPEAAEEFATNPSRWLAWLERYAPELELGADDAPRRRILLRNCYLNPRSFSRFRSDFSRAAFRVVDCPPITRQGKTSTDIHMVMDILDALGHATRFDEFILMSADADFTPVLQRARIHDRRTLVVSIGPASPAYRNAADVLIPEEDFVTVALGGRPGGRVGPVTAPEADDRVLDEMSTALADEAKEVPTLLPAAIPRIYVRFPAFRDSTDWLGHWSLRGLTEALVARRPESIALEETGTEWCVRAVEVQDEPSVQHPPARSDADVAARVVALVTDLVRSSPSPVPMAAAAQHVIAALGRAVPDSDWAGAGSFKALITGADTELNPVQLSPTRWVIVDPERHEVPEMAEVVAGESQVARLARRLSRTTGVPALTSEQYASLFDAVAAAVDSAPYDLSETSKTVRDALVEAGTPVSRTSISFVLRGIVFSGHDFIRGQNDAASLAAAFRKQVHGLCEDADLHLTEEEEASVDEWIVGEELS